MADASWDTQVSVTKSDTTEYQYCVAVRVGGSGNLALMVNGTTATHAGLIAGDEVNFGKPNTVRVMSTNTTATSIVALLQTPPV